MMIHKVAGGSGGGINVPVNLTFQTHKSQAKVIKGSGKGNSSNGKANRMNHGWAPRHNADCCIARAMSSDAIVNY